MLCPQAARRSSRLRARGAAARRRPRPRPRRPPAARTRLQDVVGEVLGVRAGEAHAQLRVDRRHTLQQLPEAHRALAPRAVGRTEALHAQVPHGQQHKKP